MLPFIEKALAAKPKWKKASVNVVHVKKLVAAVEKSGKQVATVKAAPDGSITVSIGQPPAVGKAATANPWDTVLE